MFQKQPIAASLNFEIQRVLKEMKDSDPASEEYATMVAQVKTLHALRIAECPRILSGDTVATIAANLLGILLILNFEKTEIVPKTAMTFVKKLR